MISQVGAGTINRLDRRRFLNDLGVTLDLIGVQIEGGIVNINPGVRSENGFYDVNISFNQQQSQEGDIINVVRPYWMGHDAGGFMIGGEQPNFSSLIGNFKDSIVQVEPFAGMVSASSPPKGTCLFLHTRFAIERAAALSDYVERLRITLYFKKDKA